MLEIIKRFFKKIFKKDYQIYIEPPKKEEVIKKDQEPKTNNFKTLIKIEEERALKLQKDFREGKIEEEDLSEEEFNLLYELYEKQISQTNESIQKYKNIIMEMKKKLSSNV